MTPTIVDSAVAPRPLVEAAGSPDTVICRVLPPPTGSLLGARRECRSTREWVAIHHDAVKQVDDAQQIADHQIADQMGIN
jgi:hypothetical protein